MSKNKTSVKTEKIKIKHNYLCDDCGKLATMNYQNINKSWTIDDDGNFEEDSEWEGDCNEFYCDKCYDKKFN